MRDLLVRFRALIITALVVILPLFSMYYHGKAKAGNTPIELALSAITAPMQELSQAGISAVAGVWSGYVALVDTQAENGRLLRDNQVLFGEAMRAKKLQQENGRLRKLLAFRDAAGDDRTLAARVIGKDVSPHYHVLKISLEAGEENGVKVGMPVVTHEGLVGRISKVGVRYSEVMLAVDARSQMNVKIAGRGVIGVLQGKGDESDFGASFRFLHRSEPVEENDVVVTSGHDKVFPPDLVVGYVAAGSVRQDGLYYEYDVAPAVNFSTLEEVLVLAGTSGVDAPGSGGAQVQQ
jgi:rod shape-determining protein MreC